MSLTINIPVVNEELGLVYLGLEYKKEKLSQVEGYHLKITKVLEADETKKANNIYTCNICDKDLPAAFVKEHNQSIKHKANLCISNEASRRSARITNAVPAPKVKPGGKFCKSCCVVKENNHEQTDAHRVAVRRDVKLCALVKTYTGHNVDEVSPRTSDERDDVIIYNNNPVESPNEHESDWSRSDTNSEVQENSIVYGNCGQGNESDEDRAEDTDKSQDISRNNNSPEESSGVVYECGDDRSLGDRYSEVQENHGQENESDNDEYWTVDDTDQYPQDTGTPNYNNHINTQTESEIDDIEANNIQEAPTTSDIAQSFDRAPNQVILIRRNDIPSCFRPTGINSRLKCIPCKRFVPSWPQNIEDHLRGQKHLKRMELYGRGHYLSN